MKLKLALALFSLMAAPAFGAEQTGNLTKKNYKKLIEGLERECKELLKKNENEGLAEISSLNRKIHALNDNTHKLLISTFSGDQPNYAYLFTASEKINDIILKLKPIFDDSVNNIFKDCLTKKPETSCTKFDQILKKEFWPAILYNAELTLALESLLETKVMVVDRQVPSPA
jgi:hypothetical protein